MPDIQDTQVVRVSQLDIGDGNLYEFAGANSGIVFDTIADAQAAIQAGTIKDGDVFYIKNDGGTSGYPVFIGTSAQIEAADQAGKLIPGMLIYCTDDGVNDITALQVRYDNTDSGLEATTVQGAIDEINSDLSGTLYNHTCNGTETYKDILNAIYPIVGALSDNDFRRTKLVIAGQTFNASTNYTYTMIYFTGSTEISFKNAQCRNGDSIYRTINMNTTPTIANHDYSNTAIDAHTIVKVIYA